MEYAGYGVSLEISDGSGGYTPIAQVRDINGPSGTLDTIETTSHDSSGVKEYIGGLRDAGEITFDIVYDPDDATHDDGAGGLQGLQIAKTVKQMRIVWPNYGTTLFSGLVTKFEPKAPLNDAFTTDVTLKLTGGVTFGTVSPTEFSGLALWLDANDASTLWQDTGGATPAAVDDNVARWDDKSGNGNNATQATGADQPIRKSGFLQFNDSTDQLSFPDLSVADHSVFLVLRNQNPGGSFANVFLQNSGAERNPLIYADSTLDRMAVNWKETSGPQRILFHTLAVGSLGLIEAFRTGTSGTSRVNGADQKASTVDAGSENTGSGEIGNGRTDIYELLVYNRELNSVEKAAIEGILIAKWSIS